MKRIGFFAWLAAMCLACLVSASYAQTDNSVGTQLIIVEIGPVPRAAQAVQPAAHFAVNRLTDESSLNAPYSPVSIHSEASAVALVVAATIAGQSADSPVPVVVQLPLTDPLGRGSSVGSPGSAGPVVVAVVIILDMAHRVPLGVMPGIRGDGKQHPGISPLPAVKVYRPGE